MTKEWQEATNEFLRVRSVHSTHQYCCCSQLLTRYPATEPELGPVDGYLVRRLLGQGPRAIPLGQAINETGFLLSIEAGSCAGRCSYDDASPARDFGDGALGLAGADIGWCKYCTTLTMRNLSLLVASRVQTSCVVLFTAFISSHRTTTVLGMTGGILVILSIRPGALGTSVTEYLPSEVPMLGCTRS
jgi:hypothetical protein